jgi:hypothetical protein
VKEAFAGKSFLPLAHLLDSYRTISIIGMAKNAGKTTALNHLIEAFHRDKVHLALTSIGRDGERVDIVTKTAKPQIFVFKDTIIATTEKLLALCDITKEIMQVTDINTPMGRVVVVRALSDGFVQLGGPSITTQIASLLNNIEIDKIIIDGAINRKTLASPLVAEATVLCTGASFDRNMDTVIEETRHVVRMFLLPRFEDLSVLEQLSFNADEKVATQENCIYVRGAVSDSFILDLIMSNTNLDGMSIIAEDPSKIFIKPLTYEKLRLKKAALFVRNSVNLVALTVNPFSPYHIGFHPGEFLEKMQEAVPIPVYDLKAI